MNHKASGPAGINNSTLSKTPFKMGTLENKKSKKENSTHLLKWERKYTEVVNFRKANQEIHPTFHKIKMSDKLYQWCIRQRKIFHTLTIEQQEKLEQIGITLGLYQKKYNNWERLYSEVAKLINEQLEINPNLRKARLPYNLYQWFLKQKKKFNSLNSDQQKKIEIIGIYRKFTQKNDDLWEKKFNELNKFMNDNPDIRPNNNKSGSAKTLYYWYFHQCKIKNSLTKEQVSKLDNLQFYWKHQLGSNYKIEQWLKKILEFKKNNPDRMPSQSRSKEEHNLIYACQQIRYFKNKLTVEQIQELDKVGFEWVKINKEHQWEIAFKKFVEFKKNHPDRMPFISQPEECELYRWCYNQNNKTKKLTPEKIERLKQTGFEFKKKTTTITWEMNFKKYSDFIKNNPGKQPRQFKDGKSDPLHGWFIYQQLNKEQLSSEKINKLNAIGFNWKKINRDELWEKKLKEYVEWKKMNNGKIPCEINGKKNSLYSWCYTQRRNKKNLSAEKINKLDEAGFNWIIEYKNPTLLWADYYFELIEYKKNNSGNMPTTKDKYNLSNWCYLQKKRKLLLSQEQIEKLNLIGFDWTTEKMKREQKWETKYQEYVESKKINPGNTIPIQAKEKRKSIDNWCNYYRSIKYKLSEEKIRKLNEAGFNWGKFV